MYLMDFVRHRWNLVPLHPGVGIGWIVIMLMTGQHIPGSALFLREPERFRRRSCFRIHRFSVPEEWVPVLQKNGVYSVEDLIDLNPGRLNQEI